MAEQTHECNHCKKAAPVGQALCNTCLNDWQNMRGIIQARLQAQLGEATRETQPIITREFNRLDTLWRRDRKAFSNEVNLWYNPAQTPANGNN